MKRTRSLAVLIAIAVLSLSSCDPRSYVAIVNGSRITSNDLHSLGQVYQLLSPSTQNYEIAGLNSVRNQFGGSLITSYVNSEAMRTMLFAQSRVNSSDRALYRVTLLLQNTPTIPASVTAQYQSLPQHARVVFSRMVAAQIIFAAIDSGIDPQKNSDVVCADVFQSSDEKSAESGMAALRSSKGAPSSNQITSPIHRCVIAGQTYADPVVKAIALAHDNDVLGPIPVASSQGDDSYYFLHVTDSQQMAFRDWPLDAMASLQAQAPGELSKYAQSHLHVIINPAYGKLPSSPEEFSSCQSSTLVCVVAPDDPTREIVPQDQQSQQFQQ